MENPKWSYEISHRTTTEFGYIAIFYGEEFILQTNYIIHDNDAEQKFERVIADIEKTVNKYAC